MQVWTEGVVMEASSAPPQAELCQHCRVRRKRPENTRSEEDLFMDADDVDWDEMGTVDNISGTRVSVTWDSGRADVLTDRELVPVIAVHTRMKRGPTWHYKDVQDGGAGNLGTCVGFSRKGVVRIHWDIGQPMENTYRVDKDTQEVVPATLEEMSNFLMVLLDMGATHHYKQSDLKSAVPPGAHSLRDGIRRRAQKDLHVGARVTLKQGT
jgi:hypothetical protein